MSDRSDKPNPPGRGGLLPGGLASGGLAPGSLVQTAMRLVGWAVCERRIRFDLSAAARAELVTLRARGRALEEQLTEMRLEQAERDAQLRDAQGAITELAAAVRAWCRLEHGPQWQLSLAQQALRQLGRRLGA